MNTRNFPALVDNRILRLLAFACLYFAQGLPYGLLMVALPTWLAAQDHSSTEVGLFLTAVSLPWTLKLLTGPIMDRFSFLSMGRRRPWVLTAQFGILLGCLILSVGITDFYWMMGVGFFVNFCAAWQDVAVDGMAIDILPEEERARANAFMFGGQAAGISVASGAGAWLLSNYGLKLAALAMSLCMALISLIPMLFRERRGEKLLPWTEGEALQRSVVLQENKWKDIFRDLFRSLFLPMSILLIAVNFGNRITSGILQTIFPVLTTQGLGFSDTFYPEWKAAASIIAAVFCLLMSPFIDRITPLRAIYGGFLFKSITIGIAAFLVDDWSIPGIMTGIIISFEFSKLWLVIATSSLFMALCETKIAASQFAIYMALSNLAISAGSGMTGPLDNWLKFDQIFLGISLFVLAMACCLLFFNLDKHKARIGYCGCCSQDSRKTGYTSQSWLNREQ